MSNFSNYELKDTAACMQSSMQRTTFLYLIAPLEWLLSIVTQNYWATEKWNAGIFLSYRVIIFQHQFKDGLQIFEQLLRGGLPKLQIPNICFSQPTPTFTL
jgi:hypothetical protein